MGPERCCHSGTFLRFCFTFFLCIFETSLWEVHRVVLAVRNFRAYHPPLFWHFCIIGREGIITEQWEISQISSPIMQSWVNFCYSQMCQRCGDRWYSGFFRHRAITLLVLAMDLQFIWNCIFYGLWILYSEFHTGVVQQTTYLEKMSALFVKNNYDLFLWKPIHLKISWNIWN